MDQLLPHFEKAEVEKGQVVLFVQVKNKQT